MRSILRGETDEARRLLRGWQERVLAAVQSMQIDSAAVLPLLLHEDPRGSEPPRSTPFSEHQQKNCRLDGELEGDFMDPAKRRPLVPTEDLFVDRHLREQIASMQAQLRDMTGQAKEPGGTLIKAARCT